MSPRKSFTLVASWMVIVLFCLQGNVRAQDELELSPGDELDGLKENVQEMLSEVQRLFFKGSSSSSPSSLSTEKSKNGVCICDGSNCACCQQITSAIVGLRENCCVRLSYKGSNLTLLYSLQIGARTLFSREISARQPPMKKVCVSLSYLKTGASACVSLYNLYLDKVNFKGCVWFTARLVYIPVKRTSLGCFKIDIPSTNEHDDQEVLLSEEMPALDLEEAIHVAETQFLDGRSMIPMENIEPIDDEEEYADQDEDEQQQQQQQQQDLFN